MTLLEMLFVRQASLYQPPRLEVVSMWPEQGGLEKPVDEWLLLSTVCSVALSSAFPIPTLIYLSKSRPEQEG